MKEKNGASEKNINNKEQRNIWSVPVNDAIRYVFGKQEIFFHSFEETLLSLIIYLSQLTKLFHLLLSYTACWARLDSWTLWETKLMVTIATITAMTSTKMTASRALMLMLLLLHILSTKKLL